MIRKGIGLSYRLGASGPCKKKEPSSASACLRQRKSFSARKRQSTIARSGIFQTPVHAFRCRRLMGFRQTSKSLLRENASAGWCACRNSKRKYSSACCARRDAASPPRATMPVRHCGQIASVAMTSAGGMQDRVGYLKRPDKLRIHS